MHNSSPSRQGLRPSGLGPSTNYQLVSNSMAATSPPELTLWLRGFSMGWTQWFLSHTTAAGHWKTLLLCLAAEEPSAPALPWAHCDPGQVLWLFSASSYPCMKRTAALSCTARGCDGSCLSSRAVSAADGCGRHCTDHLQPGLAGTSDHDTELLLPKIPWLAGPVMHRAGSCCS